MAETISSGKISRMAMFSLVFGLLSFGFFVVTGLPALLLGWLGLRAINRSDGRIKGRPLAVAGMITGGIGTVLSVLGLAAVVVLDLRATAQRATCANNLRRIGQATNFYHSDHKLLPAGTVPNPRLPPERRLSWYVSVLPYAGHVTRPAKGGQPKPSAEEKLYGMIDRTKAWDDAANRQAVNTSLLWLQCPAHPDFAIRHEPGLTHYLGIAGLGKDAAEVGAKDRRAGVFGYDRPIAYADIAAGISQTMMATETAADIGPWAAGGPGTVRGLDSQALPYIGPGRPFGGLHRGGLNVLFVDSSVRFLNANIEPKNFEALAPIARYDGP